MNANYSNTVPVSREEQITAIKVTAKEYPSVSSVTATTTHVIIVMDDGIEASNLFNWCRNNGWWHTGVSHGALNDKWFIRVELNK